MNYLLIRNDQPYGTRAVLQRLAAGVNFAQT